MDKSSMVISCQRSNIVRFMMIITICVWCFCPMSAEAKRQSEVSKRLGKIQKEYPDNSRFDDWVSVENWTGGGCNALVMYATLKVFHNAYTPDCSTYRRIDKSASVMDNSDMKRLFYKAKAGDVVRFRNEKEDTHFAIFLSSSDYGVYLYEANFGSKNRVKDNNFWPWWAMKDWTSGGATEVEVYRSKNYNQVNQKKAARNCEKGSRLTVEGITYEVTKNAGFGGEVKVVRLEDYYDSSTLRIPDCIFTDNMSEQGWNCNYSGEADYGQGKNINYQLTYKVTAIGSHLLNSIDDLDCNETVRWNQKKTVRTVEIGSNVKKIGAKAFQGVCTIHIRSKRLKKIHQTAFAGTDKNLLIKVPASRIKTYKKLLTDKGQSDKSIISK